MTRAPRKHRRSDHVLSESLKKAICTPGAECVLLRQYDATHRLYNSYYRLQTPVEASAVVGFCTDPGVTLSYETNGPRQCARFFVDAMAVPAEQRLTRIVKVAEMRVAGACAMGIRAFKTKTITTIPEAVFEAMLVGEDIPIDVIARLCHAVSTGGSKSAASNPMWEALKGKRRMCLFFKTN